MARSSFILTIIFGVFLAVVKDVCCYDVCYHKHSGTIYCQGEYEYCCYNEKSCCTHTHLSVSGIVGIVLGSVFLIGCLISLICLCKRKQKHRPTVIIQPHTYPGTAVSYMAYQGQLHQDQGQYGFNSYNTQYGMDSPAYSGLQSNSPSSSAAHTGFPHLASGVAPGDITLNAKY